MSNRTLQTTRGAAIPISRTPAKQVARVQPKSGESFVSMQQNMEQELERRKRDWEKEVEKLQADFFKLKPPKKKEDDGDGENEQALAKYDGGQEENEGDEEYIEDPMPPEHSMAANLRPPGAEIIDVNNSKNLYHVRPDGSRCYRLSFDVRGFEPDEVNVQVEGDKLRVEAKHHEKSDRGSKLTRQFNRQMDIPEDVMSEEIEANFSPGGILTIEAPVDPNVQLDVNQQTLQGFAHRAGPIEPRPTFSHTRSVVSGHFRPIEAAGSFSNNDFDYESSPLSNSSVVRVRTTPNSASCMSARTPARTGARTGIARYSNPLVVIVDDQRKLKLAVDIGEDFTKDDVSVKLGPSKIGVYAAREEEEPWHMKREFAREYDLPEDIEPSTLRASLTRDGRILIGASSAVNNDHDAVLKSIARDIPPDAVHLNVEHD